MPTQQALRELSNAINLLSVDDSSAPITEMQHLQARRAMSMLFHPGQGLEPALQQKVEGVIQKLKNNSYAQVQDLLNDLEDIKNSL